MEAEEEDDEEEEEEDDEGEEEEVLRVVELEEEVELVEDATDVDVRDEALGDVAEEVKELLAVETELLEAMRALGLDVEPAREVVVGEVVGAVVDAAMPSPLPTRKTFILQLPPHICSLSPPHLAEHSLSGARQLLDLALSSLAQWHWVECCSPPYLKPRAAHPFEHMARVMAELEYEYEESSRVLESVQHPRDPVLSEVKYGLFSPDVDDVERTVTRLEPPQVCAAFPEHFVLHEFAATNGRVLPQVQVSKNDKHRLINARRGGLTAGYARKGVGLFFTPECARVLRHEAGRVAWAIERSDVGCTGRRAC